MDRKRKGDEARALARWQRDWKAYATEILGVRLWSKQAEILRAVQNHSRVAVKSGHGIGKTYSAAVVALCFLYLNSLSIVLTTAPTGRQVREVLWREIRGLWRPEFGGRCLTERLEAHLAYPHWYAIGFSTDKPINVQGIHAENMLLICDEAAEIPSQMYDALDSLLTSAGSKILMIGNPTVPSGPFYDAFKSPEWHTIHVSCLDCPNCHPKQSNVRGLVTPAWIERKRKDWGENSPMFQARVLGEFPAESETTLVPMTWLRMAQERVPPQEIENKRLGVDVARLGADETVFVLRDNHRVMSVHATKEPDLMRTAHRVKRMIDDHNLSPKNVFVDDIGLGGGVTDKLREMGYSISPVKGSQSATKPGSYRNMRSQMYWNLRIALSPHGDQKFSIPKQFEPLVVQLSGIEFHMGGGGTIQVELKQNIRRRIGRSPDHADALALTFAGSNNGGEPGLWVLDIGDKWA